CYFCKYLPMFKKFLQKLFSNAAIWFWALVILFGIIYATTGIANHYYFRSYTLDYGIFNYTLWDYAHFHNTPAVMYTPIEKHPMALTETHFSDTLFCLVPFYWLLNWLTGTYTLILIQVAFILFGAWGVYKLVEMKSGNSWL